MFLKRRNERILNNRALDKTTSVRQKKAEREKEKEEEKLKEDEKLRLQQRKIAQKKEELLNAGKTESDRIKILYDKEVSQHNQNADRTIKMMDLKDNIYVK